MAAAQEIQVERDAKTDKQELYYAEWERLEEVWRGEGGGGGGHPFLCVSMCTGYSMIKQSHINGRVSYTLGLDASLKYTLGLYTVIHSSDIVGAGGYNMIKEKETSEGFRREVKWTTLGTGYGPSRGDQGGARGGVGVCGGAGGAGEMR